MVKGIVALFATRLDFFIALTLEHLGISLLSIVIAGILGLLLGIFISEYEKASQGVLTLVNIIYTIPSISLLGFLIPFSGIGNTTAVIALTVYALLPMVRNTHTGIKNINPAVIEAARGMGSTNFQILYKIKLPQALPVIMSGVRNMVTMTIALAGIASFIGAGGLGVAIYRGITTNNPALTVAGSLLIAGLAFLLDSLLETIEKKVGRRKQSLWKKSAVIAGSVLLCACVVVAGIAGSIRKNTIHIATKPMTEQHILGEMLKYMIEQDTDLEVRLTQGVGGGTSNIHPAMEKGDFDIYPEYTGTGWNAVLKKDGLYEESLFAQMQTEYAQAFSMEWLGMYGFNNTYGLAVRGEIAEEYGLVTYSDLAAVSGGLVFGAEYDFFEREDGYNALCGAYGYSFQKTMDLDIGLKYQAINQKQIDVMNIFTTDGQLSSSDIVVLVDDKGLYPSYLCGNVVRSELLEDNPEIRDVLHRLEGTIDDSEMARMNYLVEEEGKEPKDVARDFLNEKQLLR